MAFPRDYIIRDIEARIGRRLKGPDDCAVASCERRASGVYRMPDETDCSGYGVLRLCAVHVEGARRIYNGIGAVTRLRGA